MLLNGNMFLGSDDVLHSSKQQMCLQASRLVVAFAFRAESSSCRRAEDKKNRSAAQCFCCTALQWSVHIWIHLGDDVWSMSHVSEKKKDLTIICMAHSICMGCCIAWCYSFQIHCCLFLSDYKLCFKRLCWSDVKLSGLNFAWILSWTFAKCRKFMSKFMQNSCKIHAIVS